MANNYRSPTYQELSAPKELDWRPYRSEQYFLYRKQWDERGLNGKARGFPLHLDIDPTNRCNLKCRMCPRTYYLEHGLKGWAPNGPSDMDMGLYVGIIEGSYDKGLRSVKLNFLGEPLLYPAIAEMIKIAHKEGLYVMLNTNAVALTPKLSRELLSAGLTDIFFSFDSPDPRQYEKIRVGAKYDETLDNINSFMAIKDELKLHHVQTRASMVLSEDLDDPAEIVDNYIKLFRSLKVAEIGFGLPTVMGRDYSKLPAPDDFLCPDLFRRMFVFNDGICGPCCGDWERRLLVGDANVDDVSAIWNGKEYQRLRASHLAGDWRGIPACQACSVPFLSACDPLSTQLAYKDGLEAK
ncbi:MAG: radical SAM protein [Deltaproteobacteria bacterium]|nr:radical SAM protein [Deltaproteobacteria bacterium]